MLFQLSVFAWRDRRAWPPEGNFVDSGVRRANTVLWRGEGVDEVDVRFKLARQRRRKGRQQRVVRRLPSQPGLAPLRTTKPDQWDAARRSTRIRNRFRSLAGPPCAGHGRSAELLVGCALDVTGVGFVDRPPRTPERKRPTNHRECSSSDRPHTLNSSPAACAALCHGCTALGAVPRGDGSNARSL